MAASQPHVDDHVERDESSPERGISEKTSVPGDGRNVEHVYHADSPYNTEKGHDVDHQQHVDELVHGLVAKEGDREDGLAPMDDIEYVMDKIDILTVEECKLFLIKLLRDHEYDYNFSNTQREKIATLLDGPIEGESNEEWELKLKTETAVMKFYSPYPEVRAITTPTDDVNIPCETIRAHLLGYIWAVIAQFTNSLFNSRFPTVSLGSSVAQILLYPCGLFLAFVLPDWGFTFRGTRVSLNPGPWTYKEQMLSTIIVGRSSR